MEENLTINSEEADKVIEKLVKQNTANRIRNFLLVLLSHRYMQEVGITKEQFMTSLSNSIDKIEKGE